MSVEKPNNPLLEAVIGNVKETGDPELAELLHKYVNNFIKGAGENAKPRIEALNSISAITKRLQIQKGNKEGWEIYVSVMKKVLREAINGKEMEELLKQLKMENLAN